MMGEHTVVSAPGKVLLAGGYLVLDRAYTGLVVATSSRFFTSVKTRSTSAGGGGIRVRAGQFPADASTWTYTVTDAGGVSGADDASAKNKFVFLTLDNVLRYARARCAGDDAQAVDLQRRLAAGLDVVVLADNDFYSQREQLAAAGLPPRLESLERLTPFCPLPRPIGATNKTGLGSSAALVTSLVAGLLAHLGLEDVASPAGRDVVHALAQAAHCLAQGKVGSGFDVASAVYGTHIYRRFSPAVLEPLFKDGASASGTAIYDVVHNGKWDQEARPLRLPRGLRLMLADVDAGTDTPSFVGRVLAWRKANPERALEEWTKLDEANRSLEAALAHMVDLESSPTYAADVAAAAHGRVQDLKPSEVSTALQAVSAAISTIREGMRTMSKSSDVPIEPPEQTRLLDACSARDGVIGGGVPGGPTLLAALTAAGGYDAVWFLVVDDEAVAAGVQDVWGSWTEMSVSPLLSKQSDGGLEVVQDPSSVWGLDAALSRAVCSS